MASGPFYPSFVALDQGANSGVFPGVHIGSTNGRLIATNVRAVSLTNDTYVDIQWILPLASIPTGTLKLLLVPIANAASGDAVFNPAWNLSALPFNPDTLVLTAEGNTTVTWGAGDADQEKVVKIILDANTVQAGDEGKILVMRLSLISTGWTLAQIMSLAHPPALIWE